MLFIWKFSCQHFLGLEGIFSPFYFQVLDCDLSINKEKIMCFTYFKLTDPNTSRNIYIHSARQKMWWKQNCLQLLAVCLQHCYKRIWCTPYGRDLLGPASYRHKFTLVYMVCSDGFHTQMKICTHTHMQSGRACACCLLVREGKVLERLSLRQTATDR